MPGERRLVLSYLFFLGVVTGSLMIGILHPYPICLAGLIILIASIVVPVFARRYLLATGTGTRRQERADFSCSISFLNR